MIVYVKKERCGTTNCSSCNAIAPLYVVKPTHNSSAWALYSCCQKCRRDEFAGFMSGELKGNIDRRVELLRQWKLAQTPAQRGQIFAEVRKIASREETWNTSL